MRAQNRQEERLNELESRDGELLRQIITCSITAFVGGVIGYVLRNVGLM